MDKVCIIKSLRLKNVQWERKRNQNSNTPSFSIYKARRDMAQSSKLDFDHLFLLYYIFYGYKHIIVRKYIWWQIQLYQIYTTKIKTWYANCWSKIVKFES
jgi:hypothetical protein